MLKRGITTSCEHPSKTPPGGQTGTCTLLTHRTINQEFWLISIMVNDDYDPDKDSDYI